VQVGVAQLIVVTPSVWTTVLQVCMQDGMGSVAVQLELDSEFDDIVVEDDTLSVGEPDGELSGGLSVAGPSVTGGDVQLPMEMKRILMHGRCHFGRPGKANSILGIGGKPQNTMP
jgi:hypothetical protein